MAPRRLIPVASQAPDWDPGTEIVRVTFPVWYLENLYHEGIMGNNSPIFIEKVELYKEEYPDDKEWSKLQSEFKNTYRKLKERTKFLRDEKENDERKAEAGDERPL